jgi:hypothetical protein
MSTITDNFYHYQAKAEEYLHAAAVKGAHLLQENDFFKDYQIRELTHNVKETLFLCSTLLLVASTLHILFFAASLKTLLLASVGIVGIHLTGRSMENAPQIEEEDDGELVDADLEKGSSSVPLEEKESDSDEDFLNIDGGIQEDGANQIADPKGERSKKGSRSSSPWPQGKPSSTDRLLTACFRNFVDQKGHPILWTQFFN